MTRTAFSSFTADRPRSRDAQASTREARPENATKQARKIVTRPFSRRSGMLAAACRFDPDWRHMGGRWLRTVWLVATALAAWCLVTPARAAAPYCDDRGASAVAPPPQLQAPETTIERTTEPSRCDAVDGLLGAAQDPQEGGAPAVPPLGSQWASTLAAQVSVYGAPLTSRDRRAKALGGARSGIRFGVERPPRG
jgi:hypothetical protein